MTMPTPEPTYRQLALAHFDHSMNYPQIQNLKLSLSAEDLVDIWEAVSNWVEEAELWRDPSDVEDDESIEEHNAAIIRMETLMNRFHEALKVIPPDVRN